MCLTKNSKYISYLFLISFISSLYGSEKEASNVPAYGLKLSSFTFSPATFSNQNNNKAIFCMHGYLPGAFPRFLNNMKREVELVSLNSYVVVKEKVMQTEVTLPLVMNFSQYYDFMMQEEMEKAWHQEVIGDFNDIREKRGPGGINLDIPVKIRSRAFRKIFGGSTVGLNVQGDIRIQASLRREDRSEVRTAITRGANTNFKMQQTQRFTVTGKIGNKVTVNVDQDSERAFDFDNNVRLKYQGEEDEIIRKIEAGNISLSLPATRFVTFSGRNSGLFGIKTEMALGNLNVTTIASQEKGQSQKLTITGGATEGSINVPDYRYLAQTYFFLDMDYREQYRHYDQDGNHIAGLASPILRDSIEVYKAAPGYETQFPDQSIRGWALFDLPPKTPGNPNYGQLDTSRVKPGEVEFGHFIRLEKTEYYVENNLGFIRMNTPLSDEEILAVAYKTADGRVFGDLNFKREGNEDKTIILKLIKPRNPVPSNKTWDLAWKHVYSLGSRNIDPDGLEVKIFYDPPSGPDQETDNQGRRWLQVFGLDTKDQFGNPDRPDGVIDFDENILNLALGELHFRDLRPFDPEGYFVHTPTSVDTIIDLPAQFRTPVIYDTTVQSVINAQSKFYIQVKTKNKSANYNLGFNVIEGSEVVTLNGQVLRKDVDYVIDYFSGTLTILDERATDPSARVDITYERNQLFQVEKKTILGTRAEYSLGGDSFIGGTLLYLNESTLDRKVRVGRGPMRNLVWDINTRLRLKPNFIGKALDFLPLVRAKGETNLDFEGEMAQVLPTPNTLNNRKTGDKHGVAYIDDFEGSKKSVSLGVLRRNWTLSSQPFNDPDHTIANMGHLFWYNPFQQVPVKEIWPDRDVNPNVPNRVHVLTMVFIPNTDQVVTPVELSWGGIMRALSAGFFDQTQTKFIEVWIQGNHGRVHIDLGLISEDVIPDGALNTEDRKVGGTRNGILDEGEDVGIDGMPGPDPPTLNYPRSDVNAPYDYWDINRNGVKDPDEPWSYDDWKYSETNPFIYIQSGGSISGTENNINDEGGRRPDTEDINGNGTVDLANSYFEYTFSLDKTSPDTAFIAGGRPNNPRGWVLYRIPIDKPSKVVGNPTLEQIEYVRIWVDGFSQRDSLSIAEINLVGNDWKELGITLNDEELPTGADAANDTTVKVTVVNTFDNPEYGPTLSTIGVEGELDRITRVRAREQSLVLKANNLMPNYAGIVQKSLFQGENYINYKRIRMFVFGKDLHHTHITADTSFIEYFIRFGADKNNYYEYRARVYEGWDKRNHLDIDLQELTSLKDSTFFDPQTSTFIKYLDEDSTRSIRVKGNPSLTNIKTLFLGLKNLHNTPFRGEVWFNELRLSDVRRDKGMAMRVRANMRIADFATVNGEVTKKEADFHNVSTRFGNGNNQLSSNFNASINLDKILPQSWGLSMPLNLNFRQSNSTPKWFPGKDRLVTGNLPENILETIRSRTEQSGFSLSFRRQAKSKNFFLNHTIDKISFNISKTRSHTENPTLKRSDRVAWTGSFNYGIDFGRHNYISFLNWLPDLPLINKLKGTKLYYTPQNIDIKVNGTKTNQISQNRLSGPNEAPINKTETFNVTRSIRSTMKIFENLSVDFSRSHTADMRGHSLADFFKNNVEDINVTQSFNARYTPRIFSWLNTQASYSANYRFTNNLQQRTTGRSAGLNTNKSLQATLRLQQLVKSIFGKKTRRRPPRGRPAPGRGRKRPGQRRGNEDDRKQLQFFQQKKGDDKGKSLPNPLKLFGGLLSKFKDITFNYTQRRNINQFGLAAGTPSLAFQFGFSDTTNVGTVENLSTNSRTFNLNNTYSFNSGIAFGRNFDVNLRYQHSDQRNESTAIAGSFSDTWLSLGKFDMPFPEWTVSITGLEKIPLFANVFRSVSFSHSYSGQKDVTWRGSKNDLTQETITSNFRPLGKFDFNLRNGLSGSFQINKSTTLSKSLAVGIGARRQRNFDISFTANYSKRSGFRIPIWPFNNAELKNSIDFSFTFTLSNVVTEQKRGQIDDPNVKFEEQDRTDRWSLTPRITYSFSNRVRGGAFLEVGTTNSKRIGKTKIQEFGIDINIAIRGN